VSQQELLINVVRALENAHIDYMLTGSIVSSLQGEPRSTYDIDIIISIKESQIGLFLNVFDSKEFYIEIESIQKAIKENDMFNLIDIKEGDKIDFWILTDDPFDISRFSRRYSEEFYGNKLILSKPEDTILAKLNWAKLCGGSEKQFTDALRIYEVQYDNLDINYIEYWIKELNLENYWGKIKESAEIL
jgi:hypothetical protein